jgi:hypothetical protein
MKEKTPMKRAWSIKGPYLLALFLIPSLSAADLSTYRGFQFGMNLNSAAKHSGMDVSEATVIHERPARIQELNWRPSRFSSGGTDPVEQVLFSFYNGQLFRMVIDYDSERTEGLTAEDVIKAVSAVYGTAVRPVAGTTLPSASFSEGVTVIARWDSAEYSFNLAQSPYGSGFELIAFSKPLDGLAQAAMTTGTRLDEQEAPQRLKDKEQNAQGELDKARLANKAHFRP